MVKKILRWGGLVFLVYFVAFRPQSAANLVNMIGSGLLSTASGIGDFFSKVIT
jgi:hypothetical protein